MMKTHHARLAIMKRQAIIAGPLTLLFVAGAIVWWLVGSPVRPGTEIPVTLLSYTNDPGGVLTARYADSNIAHRGYAIFRIDNPTRRDFFCYIGPIFFSDGQIDLRKSQSGNSDFRQASPLSLPQEFLFSNATPYRNYRWRVEATRIIPNRCCMQVAEVWLTGSAPANQADR